MDIYQPVLIATELIDYGEYLKSLVSQVGINHILLTENVFDEKFVKEINPCLVISTFGNSFSDRMVKLANKLNFRLFLILDSISNNEEAIFKKNNEKVTFFRRPLKPESFIQKLHVQLERIFGSRTHKPVQSPYLIGNSQEIDKVRRLIVPISKTDITVLILGETGTGKGVLARAIHNNSKRKQQAFVEINCSAIPVTLLESELFGYKKGAFTGAYRDKPGKFDAADAGTILLDEISDMAFPLQAKVLQVLQDGEFLPIGATEISKTDVRIIAATNADIESLVEKEQFRQDLYFRLNAITLYLQPLRKRRGDILPLKEHFLEKYSTFYQKKRIKLSEAFSDLCFEYCWPGNVRELENIIKIAVSLEKESFVRDYLKEKINKSNAYEQKSSSQQYILSIGSAGIRPYSLKEISQRVIEDVEKKAIAEALLYSRGNKKAAANLLKISYKNILNKIKNYKL